MYVPVLLASVPAAMMALCSAAVSVAPNGLSVVIGV